MVATQQLLDSLKQIGLNLYERRLWVALISRGTSTAGELSTLAKVPHSRTYDVLESLSEKGFVMIQNTKPLKYVAIEPQEAMERAKNKLKKDTDVAVDRITQMQKSSNLKELEKIHKKGVQLIEPGELIGSLKGRHNIHQQLDTLFKGAKKNISIVTTDEGLSEIHSKHADLLNRAVKRGVKVRIAAYTKTSSPAFKGARKFAEVKKLRNASGRFCLVDGDHVVMALTDDAKVHPTQDFGLWTRSDHVAGAVLKPLFDSMWKGL